MQDVSQALPASFDNDGRVIRAILFDFDGTLTAPGAIDFAGVKRELGCPDETTILDFIAPLGEREKAAAEEILMRYEDQAAERSRPNEGLMETLAALRKMGLKIGILTRNAAVNIRRSLDQLDDLNLTDFDCLISRDDPAAIKPSPEGVVLAAEQMGVDPASIMMVGDYLFDIEAGNRAGAYTVLLTNGTPPVFQANADMDIARLADLPGLVRFFRPLKCGKLPNDLLRDCLTDLGAPDPALLIRPGIGEDTAAVDIADEEVLILKSDPITFATDAAARYAVLVNANDVATSGAVPRWLLTTLLFPPGVTAARVCHVIRELADVCAEWGISLCGGHTEITDAVTRPVISGSLAGTVSRSRLLDKKAMRKGDRILMTKAVSVEGTSIIAREFEDRLLDLGAPEEEIQVCKDLLNEISVLKEARIAADCGGVSAMHDITEGGLAGALSEFSIAGEHHIRVHMENIPVYPQTGAICHLLNIHPLGLIGSGSLLISCREEEVKNLIRDCFAAGIRITVIGEVEEEGEGVRAVAENHPVEWPVFEVDEITRLFE